MVASCEVNQDVGIVFAHLRQLQVAVVLPDCHRLVNQPPNLADLLLAARRVSVREPDEGKRKLN